MNTHFAPNAKAATISDLRVVASAYGIYVHELVAILEAPAAEIRANRARDAEAAGVFPIFKTKGA